VIACVISMRTSRICTGFWNSSDKNQLKVPASADSYI
jgi:hypothetical protein